MFADSSCGCGKVAEKPIARLAKLLGSTHASWHAKRQFSVMASLLCTELASLKKVVEEAAEHRCYCRSLGVAITKPATTREDDVDAVVKIVGPASVLQQKSITLSHHFCKDHCVEEVAQIRRGKSKDNLANGFTKGLDSSDSNNCFLPAMCS